MGDEDYSWIDDYGDYSGGYGDYGYDSGGGSTTWQNYMPGGADYIPSGSGQYSVGGGDWQSIQSNPDTYGPASYGPASYAPNTQGANHPAYQSQTDWSQFPQLAGPQTFGSGGGGGGGSRGGGGYNRPQLGAPERTLYDRYSKMLQNPELLGNDPAYQFLFNQGMQAFNRTAGARRMRGAGATAAGATQYGQGMAFDYMNKLLPQYRGGAETELNRFMGPSGLQGQFAHIGNQASQFEGAERGAQDLLPYYDRLLSGGGGGGGGPSPGAFLPTGANFGGEATPYGGGEAEQYPQRLGGTESSYYSQDDLRDLYL